MNEIDQLCSRHIAKLLDILSDELTESQISTIKRSYRYFAYDCKVLTQESNKEKIYEGSECKSEQ